MAKFDLNDDGVVVIVGSGAGGGTLGNELAQKGIKVVILEAGGRHEIADFVNDEWASFSQLAWKDMRTTSGNWRVAHDFPNLPAWIVKSVGGSTVHWAGASLRFQEHEFKARTHLRQHRRRQPARLADHARRDGAVVRARPRTRWARRGPTASRACPATTTTRCWRPAPPSSATRKCTPGKCRSTASRGTGAAPASRSASASRAASRAPSGRRCTPKFPRARRPAISRCGRTPWRCGSNTMPPARSPAWSMSTLTASSSGRRRASSRWQEIRWKARACC